MSAPASPARDSASSITRICAGPLGTVSPSPDPFWLTAEPLITPQMRSPSASASLRRFSITIPHPSPRTYPSAEASKGAHRPCDDSIVASCRNLAVAVESTAFAPPASAVSTSSRWRAVTAWWIATSDDAQARSTGTAGPSSPSVKATRPTPTLAEVP